MDQDTSGIVAYCKNCSDGYIHHPWRKQRMFCSKECKDDFHNRERLAAVKALREQREIAA